MNSASTGVSMVCMVQGCIPVSSSFAPRERGDRNDRDCCYGFLMKPMAAPMRVPSA